MKLSILLFAFAIPGHTTETGQVRACISFQGHVVWAHSEDGGKHYQVDGTTHYLGGAVVEHFRYADTACDRLAEDGLKPLRAVDELSSLDYNQPMQFLWAKACADCEPYILARGEITLETYTRFDQVASRAAEHTEVDPIGWTKFRPSLDGEAG